MSRFIETIKVIDGKCCNLMHHIVRMKETSFTFFGQEIDFSAENIIVPEALRTGIVKCRIVYDSEIREIDFLPYRFRKIAGLKMIEDPEIVYSFKSEDRQVLERILGYKGDCDEVLIVKNGCITDTSFSNVVFQAQDGLYTPSTFLLNGTKRRQLIREGIIREREIRVSDIEHYQGLYLVNAMMDLSDRIYVPINCIYFP